MTVMKAIATNTARIPSTTTSSPSSTSTQPAWSDRLILGIWAPSFLHAAATHLPGYPVSIIAHTTWFANQYLTVPNVAFNMLHFSLVPLLPYLPAQFVRRVQDADRPLIAWTVNDMHTMLWCLKNRCDGVITDDPARFLEVLDRWDADGEVVTVREGDGDGDATGVGDGNGNGKGGGVVAFGGFSFAQWYAVVRVNVLIVLFSGWFWWRFGGRIAGEFRADGRKVKVKGGS